MTKEVFITIKGSQLGAEDNNLIVTKTKGVYLHRNKKHYLQYEETEEGGKGKIKNIIKFTSGQLDMIKNGSSKTHMIFDLKEDTTSLYHTSYGSLHLQIHTTTLKIKEEENEIRILLLYTLSSNQVPLSDNQIQIVVKAI
ncbi:DUF1934 domain-containing protein [Mobilitalea sibirica]|uniref:DUF1934 domain-containing protein n=1 Tax=Mobilitalea sibirica TaxID=1462919 RepID=A0A8J7H0Q2_9FIRM|nr:DUF1934 domain-containing protein [Mobilitalea sibirica]MBH1942069.1 DUF1934 domain-containing protein [Mobilitalea sibirica]